MKYVTKQLFILLTSCCLVACATSPDDQSASLGDPESRRSDCISEGTIRDYTVLDDANLIVSASAKRKYHVQLNRRAYGLRSTWHIGFSSPTSQICAGFGEVLVDDGIGMAGTGLDRYRIRSIQRLTPEEVDVMLVRYGKKKPEIEQTPAPEPVESAEVEELD